MKRSWIGFGILLALLALCLGTGWALGRFQAPVTRDLDQAAVCALEESWPRALALVRSAQSRWEYCRRAIACVADHTPMEEIEDLFSRLTCYTGEPAEYAATCAALAQRLRALADAHSLTWWSFF